MTMKNSVFWNAARYRLVEISHRFGARLNPDTSRKIIFFKLSTSKRAKSNDGTGQPYI